MAEKFTASVGHEIISFYGTSKNVHEPRGDRSSRDFMERKFERTQCRPRDSGLHRDRSDPQARSSQKNPSYEALEKYADTLTEDLPEKYLSLHGLPKLSEAIRDIHFPVSLIVPKKSLSWLNSIRLPTGG